MKRSNGRAKAQVWEPIPTVGRFVFLRVIETSPKVPIIAYSYYRAIPPAGAMVESAIIL